MIWYLNVMLGGLWLLLNSYDLYWRWRYAPRPAEVAIELYNSQIRRAYASSNARVGRR